MVKRGTGVVFQPTEEVDWRNWSQIIYMRWNSTALYIPLFTEFHSAQQSTVPIIPQRSSTFYSHNIPLSTRHVIVHSTALKKSTACPCHFVTFQGIICCSIGSFPVEDHLRLIIFVAVHREVSKRQRGALFELPYLGTISYFIQVKLKRFLSALFK